MIANQTMLFVLIAVTAWLLLRGLRHRQDMLRFPFLAAAVMAGWFIPQAIGLSDDANLPEGGFALTMAFASICLGGILLGERRVKPRRQPIKLEHFERRLLIASVILSASGAFFYYRILDSFEDTTSEGLSTGIITIYYFFAKAQYFGFAIAILLLLNRFSWLALILVVLNLNVLSGFILFGGRRGAAIEVVLITLSAFWFQRRFAPPRSAVILGIVFISLASSSIGQYRSLVASVNQYRGSEESRLPTISEINNIDFWEQIGEIIESGSYEVRNAVHYISAASETANFNLGASYWNYFIFRYVPGQFIGHDVKAALMFDLPDDAARVYGYRRHIGTAFTGFSDTFKAFWLFGAAVFGAIAVIMQRWWRDAMLGDFEAKVFYCVSISVAMEGVTHGTEWFFAALPQIFIFTVPFLRWARRWRPPAQPYRSLSARRFGPRQSREISQRRQIGTSDP